MLIRILKKFFIMWDKWTPGDFDAGSAAIKSLPCFLTAMKLKLERSTYSKSNWTLPFLQGKKLSTNEVFFLLFLFGGSLILWLYKKLNLQEI